MVLLLYEDGLVEMLFQTLRKCATRPQLNFLQNSQPPRHGHQLDAHRAHARPQRPRPKGAVGVPALPRPVEHVGDALFADYLAVRDIWEHAHV